MSQQLATTGVLRQLARIAENPPRG